MDAIVETRPLRVGIVDDSDDVRLILRLALRNDPRFEVAGEAADGPDAIELAGHGDVDVLVLDIGMPEMDGITALEHIRKRFGNDRPAVVILSAFPPARYGAAADQLGVLAYLQKGGNLIQVPDQLFECVTERRIDLTRFPEL